MKNKLLLLITGFSLLTNGCNFQIRGVNNDTQAITAFCDASAAPFGGGAGTAQDPYLICTATQLQLVAGDHYQLSKNIDLASVTFTPLTLTGDFNGNGYSILNFSYTPINVPAGFFASISSTGVVHDLTVSNFTVSAGFLGGVGALVGQNSGTILNVSVQNPTVSGYTSIGGLAGLNSGTIARSSVMGGTVTGSASGSMSTGGFVGENSGNIRTSFCTTPVTGDIDASGFVGLNTSTGTIVDAFASGNVSAISGSAMPYLGSFVGENNGIISRTYGSGLVTQDVNFLFWGFEGGFCSNNFMSYTGTGAVYSSYWDTDHTTQTSDFYASPLTTVQMTDFVNYATNFTNWNFTHVWQFIPGERPTLRAGASIAPTVSPVTVNITIFNSPNTTTIPLSGTDLNGSALTYSIFSQASAGSLSVPSGANTVYTSDATNISSYPSIQTAYYTATNAEGVTSIPAPIAITLNYGFSGGSGVSTADPFLIVTQLDLTNIRSYSDKNFKQVNNISATGSFTPIPTFSGTYDGQGYKISNLSIGPADGNVGLFARIVGSTGVFPVVQHLTLEAISVQGSGPTVTTGALAGSIEAGTTIDDVHILSGSTVYANVTNVGFGGYTGGLAGKIYNSTITNSDSAANITSSEKAGGFAGLIQGSTIFQCGAQGNVTGISSSLPLAAGFVALNSNGNISSSYSTGVVDLANLGGGFAGANFGGTITNSYTTSRLSQIFRGGGFAHSNNNGGTISNCLSLSPNTFGQPGFIWQNFDTLTNSYYYNNGSVVADPLATPLNPSAGAAPKVNQSSSYTGFDFSGSIWKMPSANPLSPYTPAVLAPVLAFQCGKNGIVCP